MNRQIDINALRHARPPQGPAVAEKKGIPLMRRLEAMLQKDISFTGKAFGDKEKESFYLEIGSLTGAGLDIRTALQLVRDEQQRPKVKAILATILDRIVTGSSLSAAMRSDGHFTPYEYHTLEIGEETGKLQAVLQQLSQYFKARIRQRRQIIGALTYPMIVLTVAACSIVFMMNFVVPMFSDVFKRFGGELPFLTRQVLHLSQFMQASAGKLALVSLAISAFLYLNRRKPLFKKYGDVLMQRTPGVRNIATKIYLARFTATMHLLLGSSVPLVQALALSRQIVGFYPLEAAIRKMEADILLGTPLHVSMAGFNIFPSKMVALVKVGEEVNELELFFKTLTERYSEEMDHQTAQLGKFIEPVIIVVLGLVVGLVLIAMYLPMFSVGNTMQ